MADGDGVYRRDVLKASSAAAVALGLGGGGYISSLAQTGDEPFSQQNPGIDSFVGQDEVIKTACAPNCRGKCPLEAHVRDGRVRKIEPQVPEDERYKRACTLGLSHTQRVYNSTRLKYPMRRVGWSPDDPNPEGRGDDAEFERITWDEALDHIASEMEDAREQYGPESVYFETGSGDNGISATIQSRLSSLFGGTQMTWSIDINVGLGFRRLSGGGFFNVPTNEVADWKNANTVIVWGSDIFASQLQQDASKLLDAVENGAKLVCVDPVFTNTAAKADLWLPVKPGKDTPLTLAMIKTVLDEETYDTEFLRERSLAPALVRSDNGKLLDASEVVEGVTEDRPVAIDETTGEPVALEPETYGEYALFGEYTVGGVTCQTAMTMLESFVADYDPDEIASEVGIQAQNIRTAARWLATRGPGGIASGYGIDRYKYGHIFGQAYAILLALTGDYGRHGSLQGSHPAGGSYNDGGYGSVEDGAGTTVLPQTKILTAMESGDPHQLKVMYAQESNFIANQLPDRQRWLEAAKNLDLIAVADMHHTPTVQHADIILPASHWFEREDVVTTWGGHPHIMYRQPAHDPLWEAKSDHWMLVRLAERLGYGDYFIRDKSETLKTMLKHDDVVDYETLKRQGTVKVNTPTVKFKGEFNTPSGRLEIYDEDAPTENGVSLEFPKPMESRTADDWETADDYPLTFIQKHSKWRIHSQYEYQNWLREINPEPQLDINPKDAKARGIEDSDYVRVHNDRGEMVVKAKLNEAIQPGLVNTDQGWWGSDYVRGHHNDLTHTDVCEVTGNFAFYDVRVEVEPAPDDIDTSKYADNQPTGVNKPVAGAGGD
ncbi:twin-arginine translocation signal domain-containing protein [Haloferax mediterranei ATCC 33500]|nr:molybdopterin-dependent oxidoreductase [Haloferax mediterranei]AHZ23277.1 dimethyl sulfoxide reductase [Haloferax mediterranei ATCC 33500]ELZ99442.1 dimethylsulfoxide reductase [Haloferax mediterranei ATCC 33500]MDX5987353.1 molybdopterin-dependent oxidoreductase [Haloferax mediterranei ATCC 33500]QCQ76544.1 twin-arginine translocation signal domain-containing protein [Haloferax mediterranei ATCC 33500]